MMGGNAMAEWSSRQDWVELLCSLVEVPSVTGSRGEKDFPAHLIEKLEEIPYFRAHPEAMKRHPTEDGREFVTALVRSPEYGAHTVILLSHYDVVDVLDYGPLASMAFQPQALSAYLSSHPTTLSSMVREDVKSGRWLCGRGVMDMKAGLAEHIALLAEAARGAFKGNLLLLSVPDEEVNSVGMRAAVPVLVEMGQRLGLHYSLVLNSEPIFPRQGGDQNLYLYSGSMGKLLAGFYCYGKETHVGESWAGLNANYMAAHLTVELEQNTDLIQRIGDEVTPPPTNLYLAGLKEGYSVQTPYRAVVLENILLQHVPIDQVMATLRVVAERATQTLVRQLAIRNTFGVPQAPSIRVVSYHELRVHLINRYGLDRVVHEEQIALAEARGDERDQSIRIIDRLGRLAPDWAPMIVVFLAPPFYPAVDTEATQFGKALMQEMVAYGESRHDLGLHPQRYYAGLSDLSFVGTEMVLEAANIVQDNMPGGETLYPVPWAELQQFQVPVFNLGPIGRDAHQWTERLDLDYADGPLRDLLRHLLAWVFEHPYEQ